MAELSMLKQGYFFECNGQIWMKTQTKFQQITSDEEAKAAIDEIGPGGDSGSPEWQRLDRNRSARLDSGK
jgi:hypothetical protein